MKPFLLLASATGIVLAGTAVKNCKEDVGNWYCSPVQRIKYPNIGATGSYDRVVDMDLAAGKCEFEKQEYSGPMAPFDEDLSMHFRGPLVLKQFAVYKPSKVKRKRSEPQARRHHHHHVEHRGDEQKHEHAHAKKAVGHVVTATINGQVVSWMNEYDGHAPTYAPNIDKPQIEDMKAEAAIPAPDAFEPETTTITVTVKPSNCPANAPPATVASASAAPSPTAQSAADSSAAAPPPAPSTQASSAPPASVPLTDVDTNWRQLAYYSKDNGTAEGLTFLNDLGPHGLIFASVDAASGAASAQIFGGELKSQQEIAIFSGSKCEDGNCGYSRPGATAYEGFAGADKAFFMEFSMPDDGQTSGFNVNMPGVWLLNGKIPRTQQYGSCSCWASGCGEFDVIEMLSPGDDRGKSTFHKRHAGGSSDYFIRPVDGFVQLAVIMSKDEITVQQLGNPFAFPQAISQEDIDTIHDDEKVDPSMANAIFDLYNR